MRSLRAKLILSILVVTLLPVIPLYSLVNALLEKSIEVGFNQRVESALADATQMTREVYNHWREETLEAAQDLAHGVPSAPAVAFALYDGGGRLIRSRGAPDYEFPPALAAEERQRAKPGLQPVLLDDEKEVDFLRALAAMQNGRRGYVLVAYPLPRAFSRGAGNIIEVNQIFKTLEFVDDELHRSFIFTFFMVYGPFALLSILLGFIFSRRLTAPLSALAAGTRQVAAGNWDVEVHADRRDEVGQLVAAFNEMTGAIRDKQAQIIALEKMAAWREIARVLAHEIKNPLTPIGLMAQEMRDRYRGDDPAYRKILDDCTSIINEEIGELQQLVREFSDFARLPKLHLAPGNLNTLIEEVHRLYGEVETRLELDERLPEFAFDYQQIRRALINFYDNSMASLQSQPVKRITITTKLALDRVELNFTDTGAGMPEEVRKRIFEPYFSTKKSGIGLGLPIVKRIIEEHGGEIRVSSVPGQGTTFSIYLPLGVAGKAAPGSQDWQNLE